MKAMENKPQKIWCPDCGEYMVDLIYECNKEEKVCIRKEGECPNYNCQKMAKSTLLRF
jgi:hypothetical protein